ncbi:helix-turn-helix domain-containing protein [Streptomyces durmitorensis]|uniref:Helix-turn-helix domain-containing protein n=1 Tax=Streptomyces durmitorensis TaxID=319947 RepID=A0ABY4PMA4_9ACTN|nr:helix-turn-helix domain-containing protein [Streptomyces durmitorensis]UQT54237.1 helix-turn-helix domain-containing protein [Streptomyces durmitorensis]
MTNKRERVRQELLADTRLVEAVVDAVHEQVPAYTALDGSRFPEVRAIAAWATDRLLDHWVTGGAIGDADLRRFRGIAAARAADGRPLQAVLRAYRVAAAVLADEVAARAPQLSAKDAFALAQLLLTAMDTISEEMTTAYAATSERLTGDRDRSLQLLLDDLIAGRHASLGALGARASRLGVQLPERYCLLVAEPMDARALDGGSSDISLATSTALLTALDGGGTRGTSLATTHGSRAVLLLPAASAEAVPDVLRRHSWRGCVISGESLDRVAVAHRLAAGALDTAPPHAHHPERVLTDADAHVLALLAGHPVVSPDQIGRIVLGPLVDRAQRHLLEALTAYVDTGSANAAARELHLHPQSVRYRLRRVRDLASRDPQDPWQRLTLDIARTIVLGGRSG